MWSQAVNTFTMLVRRSMVRPNQKPGVVNRSPEDLVAATITQYTGTRK
jgi:hypothetical protein